PATSMHRQTGPGPRSLSGRHGSGDSVSTSTLAQRFVRALTLTVADKAINQDADCDPPARIFGCRHGALYQAFRTRPSRAPERYRVVERSRSGSLLSVGGRTE